MLGDVGGVKSPGPQNAVSDAMERRQDEASFALILGDVVYFNGQQIERLTKELPTADPDKPLIVGLHHPPYSVDSHHGGSERMGKILDDAIAQAKRAPDMVLSGHVHDYQRFSRMPDGSDAEVTPAADVFQLASPPGGNGR